MDYLIHIRKTGTAAEFATKVMVMVMLRQICQNLLL